MGKSYFSQNQPNLGLLTRKLFPTTHTYMPTCMSLIISGMQEDWPGKGQEGGSNTGFSPPRAWKEYSMSDRGNSFSLLHQLPASRHKGKDSHCDREDRLESQSSILAIRM